MPRSQPVAIGPAPNPAAHVTEYSPLSVERWLAGTCAMAKPV
jgi:hypothetical protein